MTIIDRRTLITGAAVTAALTPAAALAQGFPLPKGFERFPIWPGKAPGGERVTVKQAEALRRPESGPEDSAISHVVTPTLTILRPARPNGAAMLIIPGGGYVRVAIGHEGYSVARRFAEAGYVCFVLLYRMPGDGWAAGPQAPLQDAQRALRIVRSLAKKEKFDAARIGVMGFSAGGHLAAWLTTRAVESYKPVDAVDREPAKASAAAYIYPVIEMEGPHVHAGSRTQLLGSNPTAEQMRSYSLDQNIADGAPPAFLVHALDDQSVPPENSLAMLAALRAKGVPAECHLFENGGHGFGLTAQAQSAAPWPELFLSFAKRHGL
ncbi:alpha/beta hydrolase [Sphingobium bisphenolivorans]|uniref:alpha/beta hydrolase n=1 Tax=Sphingobium bisphenolivorans TaxID=1335760 RepID=UPI00039EF578|nr:alpha/beta hydrolase [Sphingobium bisphenolivorans]